MPFDDEDNPLAAGPAPSASPANELTTAEEGPEDEMPDYKLFMSMFSKTAVSRKSIRKGEKDFESHGTRAQDNTLETSRRALEEVLSFTRVQRGDAWVRAWYFPDWWADAGVDESAFDEGLRIRERVVVLENQRGSWRKDIGRVVPGSLTQLGVGRLWLLPEEALHLLERGAIEIWWPSLQFEDLLPRLEEGKPTSFGPDDYDAGLPLSLEAAYSLLVGYDGERGKTTLPKFQVYCHLKRSGFIILRAPDDIPEQTTDAVKPSPSLWQWLFSFVRWETTVAHGQSGPLVKPGLYRGYRPIYQQLAILPRHKPTRTPPIIHEPHDPFRVFYHVWKSGGVPFSKKSPPPPDFRIAVVDTTDSAVPTLAEIEALLQSTPYEPPKPEMQHPGRLYQRLKHGYRNVLVAIVDRGLVNFMRFGEGAFGEEELFHRFDNRGGARGKGRGGGRGRGGRGRGRGRGRGG